MDTKINSIFQYFMLPSVLELQLSVLYWYIYSKQRKKLKIIYTLKILIDSIKNVLILKRECKIINEGLSDDKFS